MSSWRQYAPKRPAIKARVSNFVQTPTVYPGRSPQPGNVLMATCIDHLAPRTVRRAARRSRPTEQRIAEAGEASPGRLLDYYR